MAQVNWEDFRIAEVLVQSGTLTKAGKALGMSHSTVLRHINRLEATLDTKLFIRHQRGYQLTDAGVLLKQAMPELGESFSRLVNQLENSENNHHGSLRITTVTGHSQLLTEAIATFRAEYPEISIHILSTEDTVPVESGSVHISIRIGQQPQDTDVIVKKLMPLNIDYYASQTYIDQHGLPSDPSQYNQHFWAMPSGMKQNIYFINDVMRHLNKSSIVYQSNDFFDVFSVVKRGLAIGPMVAYAAKSDTNLKPLHIDFTEEDESLWFVYHKDLKTNARIQSFYRHLCESLKS